MSLPEKTAAKVLNRFDEVISEGEGILKSAEIIQPTYGFNNDRSRYIASAGHVVINWPKFTEWRIRVASLLTHVLPADHIHRKSAEAVSQLSNTDTHVEYLISFLKGVKSDLTSGFLDSLSTHVEAEIASDYMSQAEGLLRDGQHGKFDHVPAAVLGGAVLEKALRTLCGQQQPPISVQTSNGDLKTLNPLIEDLKKAAVFNELKAKQLRAWADIRNKAAHGNFEQFKRDDVEQMLKGVGSFLADHFK